MKIRMFLTTGLLLLLPICAVGEDQTSSCAANATPTTPTSTPVETPAPVRVRLSWESFIAGPDGPKRVASLEKGIAKMKSLDAARGSTDPQRQKDYMRSWEYWANIHGFFGPESAMNGTVEQYVDKLQHSEPPTPAVVIASFNGLQNQDIPQDGVADKVWGTCQHSYRKPDHTVVQANFWGWHRIYLYYFERVLRWAAEDDTLNLPYWDYTNVQDLALPTPYQSPSSPLYERKRADGYNQGGMLPADDTNVDEDLEIGTYLAAEYKIETEVHGNVHCDVGGAANGCPQALMGKVPVAGNDPIFYSHHANIDRMWSCWDSMHGAPAPGAWMDESFSFPDETGTLQTRKVSEFLSTEANGYTYEQTTNCLRNPPEESVRAAAVMEQSTGNRPAGSPIVLGSVAAVKLTGATTRVKVNVSRQALLSVNPNVGPKETMLVLGQVSAQSPPGPVLRVYVETTGKPGLRKLVGTINWFAAFEYGDGPDVRDITFDITNAAKALGVGTSGLTVTFQASEGVVLPRGRSPLEAKTPRAPAFNPAANLTIGTIQIQQLSAPQ
jgi:Common central domain of tyrosinase/Polyphenol oxidase middle domain